MQSYAWGSYKTALGWRVERVAVLDRGRIVAAAQVLFRKLPGVPWSMAYVPRGPVVDLECSEIAQALFAAIHETARGHGALFLRVEPNQLDSPNLAESLERHGFHRTAQSNQPRSTILVELGLGEEALFRGLRKKTRQYIRRAREAGVEVFAGGEEHLPDFHRIVSGTRRLKGIGNQGPRFYNEAWRVFRANDSVELTLARYRGEIVAALMAFHFGGLCSYLFGGTVDSGRSVHASHLLHWECLRRATRSDWRYVDLWGIPDEVAEMSASEHESAVHRDDALWGVYQFKRGFSRKVVTLLGTFDYVYRPRLYGAAMRVARGVSVEALSGWLNRLR